MLTSQFLKFFKLTMVLGLCLLYSAVMWGQVPQSVRTLGDETIDLKDKTNITIEQLGDVEGNTDLLRQQLLQLQRQGKITTTSPSALQSANPIDWLRTISLKSDFILVFAGDLGDPLTGPFASETYVFINELRRRHPGQVFSLNGNRETNKPRLLMELVSDFSLVPKADQFDTWAASQGLRADTHDISTRLRFIFAKSMGASPAFENHRRAVQERIFKSINTKGTSERLSVSNEMVVAAVLLDLMDIQELKQFYPNIYDQAEAATHKLGIALQSLHPQPGALREYLLNSQLILHFQLSDVDAIFTHGSPTGKNSGAVPFGLGKNEVLYHRTLTAWTKALNKFKENQLSLAFDYKKQTNAATRENPAKLFIEYGSYNYSIKESSIIATKSGTSEDAMIESDNELIRKSRELSSGRPVVFISGHTPGRNAWQSEDLGPRILRLTNDSSGEGTLSQVNLQTQKGRTKVRMDAQMSVNNGQRVLVNIVNETPVQPTNQLSLAGTRILHQGKVYVVIGQSNGTSNWLVERIDSKNGFKKDHLILQEKEVRANTINRTVSCRRIFGG